MSYELLGHVAAFCTTASFLPQAILTIKTRDTRSLSFSMYGLFTLGVTLWLAYGIYKQDHAIIWPNTVTLVLSSIILAYMIRDKIGYGKFN